MNFLNYQKKRKKPVQKPDFTFIEIFWRWAPMKDGTPRKLSLRERFNRGVQLANWYAYRIGKGVDALKEKLGSRERYDPMHMGRDGRAGRAFKPASEEEIMSEREAHRTRTKKETEEGCVERMGPDSRGVPARQEVRVWLTPDMPENRVSSNQVGPERQLRVSDDPWPLPSPDHKARAADAEAESSGTKQLSGPKSPRTLPPPEKTAGQGPGETENAAPGDGGRGEAASQRGREAAHDLAARKSKAREQDPKATGRGTEDLEL